MFLERIHEEYVSLYDFSIDQVYIQSKILVSVALFFKSKWLMNWFTSLVQSITLYTQNTSASAQVAVVLLNM